MTEETPLPAVMSKSAFAAHLGLAPSYITALAKAGRLVLDGEGRTARVKVGESLALIEATQSGRFDVARRHAAARRRGANAGQGEAQVRSTPENAPKRDSESPDPERLVDAKTRKESAQADQEEMKAAQMAGNLIAREDVDAAMKFLGASVRAAMDVFPDQTAPVLCAVTDLNETHAALTEACRNVLHDIVAAIDRQLYQMHGSKQQFSDGKSNRSSSNDFNAFDKSESRATRVEKASFYASDEERERFLAKNNQPEQMQQNQKNKQYIGEIVKGSQPIGAIREGRSSPHLTNPFFEE